MTNFVGSIEKYDKDPSLRWKRIWCLSIVTKAKWALQVSEKTRKFQADILPLIMTMNTITGLMQMLIQSSFHSGAASGNRKLLSDVRSSMPMDICDQVAKLLTVQLPLRLSSLTAKSSSSTNLEEALRT